MSSLGRKASSEENDRHCIASRGCEYTHEMSWGLVRCCIFFIRRIQFRDKRRSRTGLYRIYCSTGLLEQERPQPFWPCQSKCLDRISRNVYWNWTLRTIEEFRCTYSISLSLSLTHLHTTLEYSVREKVKMFAQGSVSSKSSTGKRIPPFKLIVLDEADSLTSAAQVRFVFEKKHTHALVFIHSLWCDLYVFTISEGAALTVRQRSTLFK